MWMRVGLWYHNVLRGIDFKLDGIQVAKSMLKYVPIIVASCYIV